MDTLLTGFTAPPLDISVKPPTPIPPICNAGTPDSAIAEGIVRGGNDKVEKGYYVLSPLGTPLWIGKADVKGPLGITGGTVYGVPVEKGSGKFKGTLDHSPLMPPTDPITGLRQPPTFVGTLRLKFLDIRDRDDLDTADDGKGRCPKCHSHQRQRDDLDAADDDKVDARSATLTNAKGTTWTLPMMVMGSTTIEPVT